ncbi:SsrA-binding protein [bacterium (Candidatus Gribaldobacteria) CG_4_10_14_0_2_um_filter_33_15]|nr:MAG: SsrA-binding protein [bacterium (Candidatus Gribaldobacteria) CG10_big_fil_rev_8_21_14_0_10_33_41]PJA00370.1 MAG: SsrA-binding protein [bacterium (Candidatus Gribaldobacteria) CG_4_10_14_0_2_um_filter_33_15]PJB08966.1 MAG: SsrA-binding protein [bacterium (Candidatus Gribaldobacteria) CG_4_9_14_3_um_filter_33_9]
MKPIINKKAYFNYEILETFQAGIVLIGQEVKSIKNGRISLAGSYIILKEEEFFLIGANVPPYQPKNAPRDYDPKRFRKLLLKKSEIKYLIGKSRQMGLTLIPLKVYTKQQKIKLEFGLAKGKKKVDKREKIKKREIEREIRTFRFAQEP